MAKITSEAYLQDTMRKARQLQERYNKIGAASTQAIRNPKPMHQLVLDVLPYRTDLVLSAAKRKFRLTGKGKRLMLQIEPKLNEVSAADWKMDAISFDDIISKLNSQGFICNPGTVACALQHIRHTQDIGSIRCNKFNARNRNISYCRYFIAL